MKSERKSLEGPKTPFAQKSSENDNLERKKRREEVEWEQRKKGTKSKVEEEKSRRDGNGARKEGKEKKRKNNEKKKEKREKEERTVELKEETQLFSRRCTRATETG